MGAFAAVNNSCPVVRECLDNVAYYIEIKPCGTLNLKASRLAQKEEFLDVAVKCIKANKKMFAKYENRNISAERYMSASRNIIYFNETIKKGMLAAHVNIGKICAKELTTTLEIPICLAIAYGRMFR